MLIGLKPSREFMNRIFMQASSSSFFFFYKVYKNEINIYVHQKNSLIRNKICLKKKYNNYSCCTQKSDLRRQEIAITLLISAITK